MITRKPKKMSGAMQRFMVQNASLIRSDLIKQLLDPRIDMNYECGYPTTISAADYHLMYSREGLAKRVVSVYPSGCWSMPPEVYEGEEPSETEFESALKDLDEQRLLWHFMGRADELSGVGRFGILLLGLDDGQPLNMPADGINERGERDGNPSAKLLYLRAFDESVVTIASSEQDRTNPRFGFPLIYNVNFFDEATGSSLSCPVHWSRVLHVADNRRMSEVFGHPRMEPVYNRLLDIRKILSGSGEMFWKGAFPGYSLEVNPDLKDVELDSDSLRDEMQNYQMGLQRYLALTGVSAKSLAPQVADPTNHINAQVENIAITLGIPKRVLEGSERGELASGQDAKAWNGRLAHRQEAYLSPMVVRPFITRLVQLGVLPETKETTEWGDPVFTVEWPDLNTVTDLEKADVAGKRTEALAKFVGGNVESIVPLEMFLTHIMEMSEEEVQVIVEAAEKQALETEKQIPDEGQVQPKPLPPGVGQQAPAPKPARKFGGGAKQGAIPFERPVTHGGPGSGNFGHSGRPGEVGGSGPSGGSSGASGNIMGAGKAPVFVSSGITQEQKIITKIVLHESPVGDDLDLTVKLMTYDEMNPKDGSGGFTAGGKSYGRAGDYDPTTNTIRSDGSIWNVSHEVGHAEFHRALDFAQQGVNELETELIEYRANPNAMSGEAGYRMVRYDVEGVPRPSDAQTPYQDVFVKLEAFSDALLKGEDAFPSEYAKVWRGERIVDRSIHLAELRGDGGKELGTFDKRTGEKIHRSVQMHRSANEAYAEFARAYISDKIGKEYETEGNPIPWKKIGTAESRDAFIGLRKAIVSAVKYSKKKKEE